MDTSIIARTRPSLKHNLKIKRKIQTCLIMLVELTNGRTKKRIDKS